MRTWCAGHRCARAWLIPALAWLGAQIAYFQLLGVRSGGDSGRYLDAASALLAGTLPAGKATSYLGYDAFVALFIALGTGVGGVIAGQVLLSAAAVACVYGLGRALGGHGCGMLAALACAVYPDLQMWNYYVLTESLFASGLCISAWLVHRARTPAGVLLAALAVLVTASVRPHGLVLVGAVLVYVLARIFAGGSRGAKVAAVSAVVLGAAATLRLAGPLLAREDVLAHYASGTVIWGYDAIRLDAPVEHARGAASTLLAMLGFAWVHTEYFLRLVAAKLGWFLLHARPYYSAVHNAFTVATLLPCYALAVAGLAGASRPLVVLVAAVPVAQAAAVSLTFADWDGRHLSVVLPFVFLLAAAGGVRLARQLPGPRSRLSKERPRVSGRASTTALASSAQAGIVASAMR